ncbi:MAG: acetoacetate decarboxylase family protein [Armatimonadetes bacterium]|nr:acetoacetate decarboxylase family protein [Armatimonadota bacterium]
MASEFLYSADIRPVEVPGLGPVGLPFRCFDMAAAGAVFSASAEKMREMLPSQRLKPVGIAPGKALIILAAIDYRRLADIEPYREIAVLIPARCEGDALSGGLWGRWGAYVAFMPVTSEASRALGASVWGYPKRVGEIDFVEEKAAVRTSLRLEGQEVLALQIAKTRAWPVGGASYSFTLKGSKLTRTRIAARGRISVSFGGRQVSLSLGSHPEARALAKLGMSEKALAAFYAPQMEALIYPPGLFLGRDR